MAVDEKTNEKPVPALRERPPDKPEQACPRETGGPAGLEPTRYGDWERKGRCIDF
jgi:shikimate dehydrogenase